MVTGTCYVVARPLNAALRIRREEREMAYGQSKAETIRRCRDRLKEQPQERSLIAGAGSTRSRPRWACLTSCRCRNSKLRTNLNRPNEDGCALNRPNEDGCALTLRPQLENAPAAALLAGLGIVGWSPLCSAHTPFLFLRGEFAGPH